MFKLFLITVNLLFRTRRSGQRRDDETRVKFHENIPKPFEVFSFPFNFPADAYGPVFVASHCFDSVKEFSLFDKFVDYIGVFVLDFFNTILKNELT